MYSVENISRISILTDHQNPRPGDNTEKSMNAYYPLVRKVCEERSIADPRKMVTLLIQSVQGAFLRTDMIREDLGIDLRDAAERKKFIDGIVDVLFR